METEQLVKGISKALNDEAKQQVAEEFLRSNGFKLTEAGVRVALVELEDMLNYMDVSIEQASAVLTAVAACKIEEEDD